MRNISFLLGAGFSVNQGYPKAQDLSSALVGLDYDDFRVTPSGTIGIFEDKRKDVWTIGSYKASKSCLLELIKYFNEKYSDNFNYEEFYDFLALTKDDEFDAEALAIFNKYISKEGWYKDLLNLRSDILKIFSQIISWKISDNTGDKFYSSNVVSEESKYDYKGFLSLIISLKANDELINIHSLNHDVFLESLNYTDEFGKQLSDGFTDRELYYEDSDGYEKKLLRFTNDYSTNLRVFKLHGSFDIIPFHDNKGKTIDYVKFPWKTDLTNIKRRNPNGKDGLDFSNYHSDFLSGTSSKILSYREPIYYDVMFGHFKDNLASCDKFVIIGYGCFDSEINNMIDSHLREGIPIYVVDPYPSQAVLDFVAKKGAKLIEKTPREIELSDFDEN
ncbi:hypothetical protein [Sphingobacterium sp. SGL-16]|uniref:hypothetical protein n=1 Tax=Sphingobacterium sp. SGL-16 TaxID=2710883 RepID=UPI0013ED9ACE|nr:hypothetical protein [Sphingobacterium sp. SGL-16]NGM71684.1 hypothetical protein [Sphingobacterium sp. SGL-16]